MYMHGSRWGGEGGRADNFPQKNSNFIFHSSCKNNHKNASDPTPPSPTRHNLTLNFTNCPTHALWVGDGVQCLKLLGNSTYSFYKHDCTIFIVEQYNRFLNTRMHDSTPPRFIFFVGVVLPPPPFPASCQWPAASQADGHASNSQIDIKRHINEQ